MTKQQCKQIQKLICADHPQVLNKWSEVIDELLTSAVDISKIKGMLKTREPMPDIILETFELWIEDSTNPSFNTLVGIFRTAGFKNLAGERRKILLIVPRVANSYTYIQQVSTRIYEVN